MTTDVPSRVVQARRTMRAGATTIFELIADPAHHRRWDGNDNVADAAAGQRITAVGQAFTTTLTMGAVRVNHVVEFEEGRRIAWKPSEPGGTPFGQLWRFELEPIDLAHTEVVHTYDWSALTDERRLARARATTPERLMASLDRLARLVELP